MNKNIIITLRISGITFLLIILFLKPVCRLKKITNIPCPICGVTRGILYFLKLDLLNAIKSNILSIPIFILGILFYILYFYSIAFKTKTVYKYYNYFVRNYKLIICILLINWIIEIIKYM